ncbi:MAG: hypothetical protein HYU28_09820 [Actinobacteria bacterium]|nr:hypothetical protein [Actinomycetota bacterium]
MGGALCLGNVLALVRRRREGEEAGNDDLARAPVARTVAYAAIGFVVMLAGIGSLVAT